MTKSISAAAREAGLKPDFVLKLVRNGMPLEEALKQRPASLSARGRMSKARGHWTKSNHHIAARSARNAKP